MENNLYYTPIISEFYVGFEYEFKIGDNWKKTSINISDFSPVSDYNGTSYLEEDLVNNIIKVKYLDQSDIESLGWEFEKDIYRLNDYNLHFNKVLTITKEFILNDIKLCMTTIFEGNIKNKSELIKLMQQLNIK